MVFFAMPEQRHSRRGGFCMQDIDRPSLRLPDSLPSPGLLVGWSVDLDQVNPRFGFNFGEPDKSPKTGYVDPVLMDGEGHVITIAPTGAGKGTGCIIPALLRFPGPVIVVDPKGENAMITARRRRDMGQQVVVIDPMGLTGLATGALNPLDLLDPDSDSLADDAASIIATLVPSDFGANTTDGRYWQERGASFLLGIMLHVIADMPVAQRTLAKVRELVTQSTSELGLYAGVSEGRSQADMLKGTVLDHLSKSRSPEARQIGSMMRMGALSTMGGIVSFSQSMIDFVRSGLVAESLASSTFDLDAITRGDPVSIYLVLPPHMLDSHSRLLRLWVNTLMSLISRRRARPALSTLFILDEAAQLGVFDPLRQALTLMRGYGLQTWSLWQDGSQIINLYLRDWQTMVNNCRAVQCFSPNTMLAAKAMADIVGHDDPAALLDMPDAQMLLQISGGKPLVVQRPDYRTDPAFTGQFDANPYHDPTRTPMPERRRAKPAAQTEAQPPAPDATAGDLNDLIRKMRQRRKDGG
jgi:type IV secretion system protein VirD4